MSFLSRVHRDIRNALQTRRGATHDAKDVPTGTHKEYPRMEQVSLPLPPIEASLTNTIDKRRSAQSGDPAKPLLIGELGALLGHALRKRESSVSRQYPSGGALFPIETYLITTSLNQTGAVLHYNPTLHALERLWNVPHDFDIKALTRNPEWLLPNTLIVFTAVWSRSSAKYGDLAYQHALIEAGHMSQNILLLATALNLEARPYAGFNDDLIAELLEIDIEQEQPVHTVTITKKVT